MKIKVRVNLYNLWLKRQTESLAPEKLCLIAMLNTNFNYPKILKILFPFFSQ